MRRLAAFLVLAVIVAGCGSDTTERSAGGPSSAAPPSPGGRTAAAPPSERASNPADPAGEAPFGTVDAVGGGRIDGAELAGQDLALWFWAPW